MARRALVLVWWLLAGAAAPAAAQSGNRPEAVELEDAAARQLFEVATAHYQQGRFLDAAHEYEEAYRLSTRAPLLFNAYVAYRDASMQADAARLLRAYLESGAVEPERRPMLDARLASMEADLAEHPEERRAEPRPRAAGSSSAPAAQGDGDVLAGTVAPILLGVGAASLIAAAITGGLAVSTHDALSNACGGDVCPPDRQGDIDSLATLTTVTDVLWPIGAAAVAVGLVLIAVDLTNDGETTATAACGPAGCQLVVGGSL